jgi:hypothetical protein
MLRTVLRPLRLPRPLHSSLVSSVLLTRTYENHAVAELKKIAKDRGLSPYAMVYFILFYFILKL